MAKIYAVREGSIVYYYTRKPKVTRSVLPCGIDCCGYEIDLPSGYYTTTCDEEVHSVLNRELEEGKVYRITFKIEKA
jgi:hypothetical protein